LRRGFLEGFSAIKQKLGDKNDLITCFLDNFTGF
jgi:hypothetical protein